MHPVVKSLGFSEGTRDLPQGKVAKMPLISQAWMPEKIEIAIAQIARPLKDPKKMKTRKSDPRYSVGGIIGRFQFHFLDPLGGLELRSHQCTTELLIPSASRRGSTRASKHASLNHGSCFRRPS